MEPKPLLEARFRARPVLVDEDEFFGGGLHERERALVRAPDGVQRHVERAERDKVCRGRLLLAVGLGA